MSETGDNMVDQAALLQRIVELEVAQKRAETVARISAALSQARDEQDILAAVAPLAETHGAALSSLGYFEDVSESSEPSIMLEIAAVQSGDGKPLPVTIFPDTRFATSKFYELTLIFDQPDELYYVEDVMNDPRLGHEGIREFLNEAGIQAFVYVALRANDEWQGFLAFNWNQPTQFDTDTLAVFEAVFPTISAVISRRRAYLKLEAMQRRTERIADVINALTLATTEQEILHAIAQVAVPYGVDYAALAYVEVDAQQTVVALETVAVETGGGKHIPFESLPFTRYPIADFPFIGSFFERHEMPSFYSNILTQTADNPQLHATVSALNLKSITVIPLKVGERWQGVVTFNWEEEQDFDDEFKTLLTELTPRLAELVASRRAYLAEQTTRREIEKLYRITNGLNRATTVDELLDVVSVDARRDGAISTSILYVYADEDGSPAAAERVALWDARPNASLPQSRFLLAEFPIFELLQAESSAPFVIEDVITDKRLNDFERTVFGELSLRSGIILPVLDYQGGWLAFVSYFWEEARRFSDDDRALYQAIMQQLGPTVATLRQTEKLERAVQERTQELDESRRFAESIAASTPIHIYVHDLLEKHTVFANKPLAALAGYSADEFEQMGVGPDTFIHPQDRQAMFDALHRVAEAQDGEVIEVGYRVKHRSGEWRHLYDHITVFNRLLDGRVHQILGTQQDITERVRAEEALRWSEQNLKDAQYIAKLGNYEFDLPVQNVKWSDEVYRIYGMDIGTEITLERYQNLLNPEDFARGMYLVKQAIASKQPYNFEHTIVLPDGTKKIVNSIGNPKVDEEGDVVKIFGVVQDITERKRAEAALAQSEARSRAMLEAIPDTMFTLSRDGIFLDYHTPDLSLLITAPDQFLGKPMREVLPSALVDLFEHAIAERIASGMIQSIEYELPLNGVCNYFEARFTLSGADEVLVLVRNITERKQAEQALAESESRYRVISELISDYAGEVHYDANGELVVKWTTDSFTRMGMFTKGNTVKENSGVHPDDKARHEQDLQATLQGQRTEGTYRIDTINGMRWIAINRVPTWDETRQKVNGYIFVGQDVHERILAEEALHQTNLHLQAVLESTTDQILALDRDGRYIAFNSAHQQAMKQSYGVDIELGKLIWDGFTREDDRAQALRAFERAMAGERLVVEEVFGEESLTRTYYELYYQPMRDEHGGIIGITTFARDITARRQAEAALMISERKWRSLVETSPDLIAIINLDKTNSYFNRPLPGLAVEQMVGTNAYDLVPPDLHPLFDTLFDIVVQEGTTASYETIVPVNNGQRWFNHRLVPMKEGDQVVGVMNISTDITERKHVEEALQEQQEFLRHVIDSSPSPIFVKDRQSRFLLGNKAVAQMNGLTVAQLIGKRADELSSTPEESVHYHADDRTVIESKRPLFIPEESVTTAAGEVRWLQTTKVPLFNADGTVDRLLAVSTDITERKRAEDALRESEERLSLVFNNTSDLQILYAVEADSQMRLVAVNEAYLKTARQHNYKITANDLIGKYTEEILTEVFDFPPDSYAREKSYIDKAIHSGEVQEFEQIIPIPNANVYMEIRIVPVLDAQNVCRYVLWISRDVTERKHAAEALRESEARYRALIQSQTDLISRYRPDTNLTFVNDAFCQFYGKTREELIGETYLTMVAPEFREMTRQETENLVKNPRMLSGEYLNFRHDGKPCWIHWIIQPILDEQGQVVEMQAIGRDITERRRVEEALRESEFFLQKSQMVGRLGSYYFDTRTGIWLSSPMLDELFGIDESYNKNVEGWISLIHPDDQADMLKYLSQYVLAEHNRFDREYRIRRHNSQQELWVYGLGELEFDEQGNVTRMIGTIQDITESKRAAEALRQSEERYRLIVETAQEGIWLIDDQAITTYVNPKMAEILGYTAAEMLGRSLYDFMDDAGRTIAEKNVERRRQGIDEEHEFRFKHKNGSDVWTNIVTNPIMDAHGQFVAALAMVADITERKRAADELWQSKHMLQRVLDHIPSAVVWKDRNCVYLGCNQQEAVLAGLNSPEEIVGLTDYDLPNTSPESAAFYQQIDRRVMDSDTPELDFEEQAFSPNGPPRWLKTSKVPLHDAEGSVIGVLIVFDDITERKQLEQDLLLTQFCVDNASIGIMRTGADAKILSVNQKCCDLLGYTPEEFSNLHIYDIDPQFPMERWLEHRGNLRQRGTDTFETVHRRKDGTTFPVEITTTFIAFRNSEFSVSFLRDITESKRTQEALRLNSFAVERASDAVYWVDSNARIVDVNEAACHMLGYSREEFATLSIADIEANQRLDEVIATLNAVKEGKSYTFETRHKTKAGHIFPVEVLVGHVSHEGKELNCAFARDITQRKRAEEALKKSQALLNESQAFAHIGSWSLDDKTGELNWTDETFRLFGLQPQDVLPTFDMLVSRLHSDDQPLFRAHYQKTKATGQFDPLSYRVVLPDGNVRWILNTGTAYTDEAGEHAGYLGMVHDITESKRIQEALRENEERLKLAVSVGSIGIFDHDHLANSVYWSPEHRNIYGFGLDEPIEVAEGRNRTYPDDRERIDEAVMRAHDPDGNGVFDVEYRIVNRRGDIRWLSTKARTYFEGEGSARHAIRTVGAVMDITERKRADTEREHLLLQTTLLYEISRSINDSHDLNDILQVAVDVMFESGMDSAALSLIEPETEDKARWSEVSAEWWRSQAPFSMVGQRVNIFEHPFLSIFLGEWDKVMFCADVLTDARIPEDQRPLLLQSFVRSFVLVPLQRGRQWVGLISFAWQHPHIMTESELAVCRALLDIVPPGVENRHLLRTLEATVDELNESLLFRDRFLATMSHELRTPMNAIMGYAGIAASRPGVPENVVNMLDRIDVNSRRLLNLINDVLDISRMNAGRVEIVESPFHLPPVVQGWVEDFSKQAEEKGLRFESVLDPALPIDIMGDQERITRIVTNLLTNAIKFTDQGSVGLEVKRQDDQLIFAVSDTGIGIAKQWHHVIFEEFRQVDMSTTRRFGGSGLGLSIVKRLCDLMHGTISVESELGKGSVFRVVLPLKVPVLSNGQETHG